MDRPCWGGLCTPRTLRHCEPPLGPRGFSCLPCRALSESRQDTSPALALRPVPTRFLGGVCPWAHHVNDRRGFCFGACERSSEPFLLLASFWAPLVCLLLLYQIPGGARSPFCLCASQGTDLCDVCQAAQRAKKFISRGPARLKRTALTSSSFLLTHIPPTHPCCSPGSHAHTLPCFTY